MNLDEMKLAMAASNARLEQSLRLNTQAIRQLQAARGTERLGRLVPGLVCELVMAMAAVVWLGNFIFEHRSALHFAMSALLLDLSVIALMGACIRQLSLIANLDATSPVVALQKQLGQLRLIRLRSAHWTFVLSFVLWLPLALVLAKGLLGVNLWPILAGAQGNFLLWLFANAAFGWAVAMGLLWAALHYGAQAQLPPVLQTIVDDVAGRSLTAALSDLAAIAQFEREPGDDAIGA